MNIVPLKAELHQKLAALGIPVERQDATSLSNLFPPEFRVANFGLSQTDIAEVLVAFVKHGLISLSSLSDDSVARRTKGSHVCHFYREENEMVKMTAEFLEEGLRAGERCLWILPAWLDGARAREASRAIRAELAEAETYGRILFLTENDVYFDLEGSIRTAPEIIEFWSREEQKALAVGFSGIRITGDGTALVTTDAWESGVEYERLADEAFKGRHITALCTYSLGSVTPDRLAEVLHGHNCGLVRRSGAWDEIHSGTGVATAIEFLHAIPS